MTEADVQRDILEYLKLRGAKVWRQNTGARGRIRFGFPGLSDIIGCLPGGQFIAIEVKSPHGGRVTPEQRAFIESITVLGGRAGIVRSVSDVIGLLEGIPA